MRKRKSLDDVTGLSRQRRWQLRKLAEGGCSICGKPRKGAYYCARHRKQHSKRILAAYHERRKAS